MGRVLGKGRVWKVMTSMKSERRSAYCQGVWCGPPQEGSAVPTSLGGQQVDQLGYLMEGS